jgi:hypothetical protein
MLRSGCFLDLAAAELYGQRIADGMFMPATSSPPPTSFCFRTFTQFLFSVGIWFFISVVDMQPVITGPVAITGTTCMQQRRNLDLHASYHISSWYRYLLLLLCFPFLFDCAPLLDNWTPIQTFLLQTFLSLSLSLVD